MSTAATARPSLLHRPAVVIVAGCLIALIAFGIRSTMGLFLSPVSEAHGWGRETFGLAMALQNLVWGIAQPFVGMAADRFGAMRVIMAGALIYGAGVIIMALAPDPLLLNLGGGLLMGLGIAGTSFALVMSAFGRLVPAERRSWSFGLATAASSMGQFVFAPLGQGFIAAWGWQTALLLLAATTLAMVFLAVPLGVSRGGVAMGEEEREMGLSDALRKAFGHSSYLLLNFGFFVCGFQIAFMTVHLPPYLVERGASPFLAAWAIGIVGLFNIVGSYLSGMFGNRGSRRMGLSFIYLARAVLIVAFLFTPISTASVIAFTALIGLLWLATVPLTMGLVTLMFGTRYMATLYGFVFLSHQVGSFIGVWLGGYVYDRYGSYDMVWWLAVALGLFAAIVHLPIREERAGAFAAAVAR